MFFRIKHIRCDDNRIALLHPVSIQFTHFCPLAQDAQVLLPFKFCKHIGSRCDSGMFFRTICVLHNTADSRIRKVLDHFRFICLHILQQAIIYFFQTRRRMTGQFFFDCESFLCKIRKNNSHLLQSAIKNLIKILFQCHSAQ